LNSETNLEILAALSVKPSHTRDLSLILGKDETDISRRLRSLEKAGLVKGSWLRVGGKNVKVYSLTRESVTFRFSEGRIFVSIQGKKDSIYVKPRISLSPPMMGKLVGRDEELRRLSGVEQPVVHVWAPPDYGKSHLVASLVTSKFGSNPVMWYYSDSSDSIGTFTWKIGATLIHAGYRFSEPPEYLPYIEPEGLAEGLETTRSVLVVDDFDKLQEPLKKLVLGIARRAKRSRVFVISRRPAEPLNRVENAYTMELGPLSLKGFTDLLSYYGVETSREEIEKSYKILSGVPGLARIVARLWDRREPLHKTSRRIVKAYIGGKLLEEIGQPTSSIAKVLASTGTSIPVDILCSLSSRSCDWLVKMLRYYGVVDVIGDRVMPRQHLVAASLRLSGNEKRLLARVIRGLAKQPSYLDKVRAVMVAARNCMTGEIIDLVEDRLLSGYNWPLANAQVYMKSLKKITKCGGIRPREYMTVKTEIFVIETMGMKADVEEIEENLEEYVNFYREHNKAIYARLLAIAGAVMTYVKNEGHEIVLEALNVYRSLSQWRQKLSYTLLPNAAMVYVYQGRLDEALKLDKEYEKRILEDPRQGLDGYFFARGVMASHLMIAGRYQEAYPIAVEALKKAKEYKLSLAVDVLAEYVALLYMGLGMYSDARKLLKEVARTLQESTWRNSMEALIYILDRIEKRDTEAAKLERRVGEYCSKHRASFISCTLYEIARHALESRSEKARDVIIEKLSKMPGIAKIGEDIIERLSKRPG
jgi:tetratricopeptide (TPR) repeat protein/DNA-binding transcriptional ArsR family regulator